MNMLGLSSSVHFAYIACYCKIFAFALRTSPLSIQALQDRFCLIRVSQSVWLGVEPRPGLMTRYLLLFDNFCFVLGGGAPSLTRGWVCLFSAVISQLSVCTVWHIYTIYTRPLSVRAQYSRLCPISFPSFRLSLYRLRKDHIENISHSCSVLYALPSNELFTKNLSSRELFIDPLPSSGNACYNIVHSFKYLRDLQNKNYRIFIRDIFSVYILLCTMICGIMAVKIAIEIRASNCLHLFYLITATCFGPHFGPSSDSFIKYVWCYWNIPKWIHISFNHYSHIIHVTITKL
jgi:hypothetical protein